jgi:hypothetical protein
VGSCCRVDELTGDDRKSEDIFALQDEITLSVVGAIEPSLRSRTIVLVYADNKTGERQSKRIVLTMCYRRFGAPHGFGSTPSLAVSPSSAITYIQGSVILARLLENLNGQLNGPNVAYD